VETRAKVLGLLEAGLVDQEAPEGADVGCCVACVAGAMVGSDGRVTSLEEQEAIGRVFQEIAAQGHETYEVFQGRCGKHTRSSVGTAQMIRRRRVAQGQGGRPIGQPGA
jgi:hypothetical protein